MAGGFVKQRGAQWYYICSWSDPQTGDYQREWVSPKRGGFVNTKRGAERALAARIESIEAGERPGLAKVPLAEWVARWITGRVRAKPSSRANWRSWLRLYIAPHIGGIPIGQLTSTDIAEWHGKLLSGAERHVLTPRGEPQTRTNVIGHATVEQAHNLVSWSLGAAVEDRIIRVNVATKTPPPAGPPKPPRTIWTIEQQQAVIAASGDEWAPLVTLMLSSGLRVGELCALRWEDVDLVRGIVMVQQGVSFDEQRRPMLSTPKSQTSIRPITLPALAVDALQRHHDRQRFVRRATGAVFRRPNGNRLNESIVLRNLQRIAVAADVPPLSPHGLRHTHGSTLMEQGVPLKVVQERLGHASPGYTAEVYQHVSSPMQERAAQAIQDALGTPVVRSASRIDSSGVS